MSKKGGGSWSDGSHWGTTSGRSSGQRDYYVGSRSGGGKHCHAWNDRSSGSSGVVHRGQCKSCDDKKSGGSSSGK